MSLPLRSPVRGALRSPEYGPLVGKWGGLAILLSVDFSDYADQAEAEADGWVFGTGWSFSGGVANFNNPTGTTLYIAFASVTDDVRHIYYDISGTGNFTLALNSPGTNTSPLRPAASNTGLELITATANRSRFSINGVGGANFNVASVTIKGLAP